jgi:hypothetical protein
MAPRRSPAVSPIPESAQKAMRERLQMARVSRGLKRSDQDIVGFTTLGEMEMQNISKARLGDLYNLAISYNMSPQEFIGFILGNKVDEVTEEDHSINRVVTFMRSLPPDLQDLAGDLVQRLVSHHVATKTLTEEQRALREEQHTTVVTPKEDRRDSREIINRALMKRFSTTNAP